MCLSLLRGVLYSSGNFGRDLVLDRKLTKRKNKAVFTSWENKMNKKGNAVMEVIEHT